MYKLLIVDDEEIEREGMAGLIPWKDYDVELVGTAWNGVEGFEKIQTLLPDIVLTDIKMPVMDGIELIRRTRENYPNVEFVVLSGYGEYEFTSQAMAYGIRHYILKPCDEAKIVDALNKVKGEIDTKRAAREEKMEYRNTMVRLLPRARDAVFRNLLLGRAQLKDEYQMFLAEMGNGSRRVKLLSMRSEESFDNLEQFVLENVLQELLGEKKVFLSTVIHKDVLFLMEDLGENTISPAVERALQEFKRVRNTRVAAAVSQAGELEKVDELYGQIQELYRIGDTQPTNRLLYYELFREMKNEASLLTDFDRIINAQDYAEILFEVYLSFMKMELKGYSSYQKKEAAGWILKILYGQEETMADAPAVSYPDELWGAIESVANTIACRQGKDFGEGKEEQRVKSILLAVFFYIRKPELNIHFLATEVLFMNEDYFGKIFVKNRKIKFSNFLLEQRIHLAKRLMQYDPELMVSKIAEMIGYSPDGQYFSKAFRKVTGKSPSEYRCSLQQNKECD